MPLNEKGQKIMDAMLSKYGAKKGKKVFYASRNKGTIKGVDPESSTGTPPKVKRRVKARFPKFGKRRVDPAEGTPADAAEDRGKTKGRPF